MGDIRGKPEGRGPPSSGVDRIIEIAQPLAMKALAFARTLPGRAQVLVQRAELPRRLDAGRKWVEAQDFPSKARKSGLAAVESARTVTAFTQKVAATTVARASPVLASGAGRLTATTKALGAILMERSTALSAALDKRRATAAAKRAERTTVAQPQKTALPVPSELMRLLKEEGVEVDGIDVREALPQPVRPAAIQGVLPLFADDPPAAPGQGR